ncbi:Uncharacterised protein [Mycobacteroides abscessus subsp. abscessus]|nr:Uncharacterised protein [Mycobacteroides abscessus subsp. abscessus]
MREQHRLRSLQVCLPRHDGVGMCASLSSQRLDDVEHTCRDRTHRLAQPHAKQRGDLIVARPSGAQPATEVGSDAFDESAFEGAVHVLVGLGSHEGAVGDVARELVETGEHGGQIVVGQQACAIENPGVRLRRLDVERGEHPVELRRLAQRGHRVGGSRREATAPQRPLVRCPVLG